VRRVINASVIVAEEARGAKARERVEGLGTAETSSMRTTRSLAGFQNHAQLHYNCALHAFHAEAFYIRQSSLQNRISYFQD